MNNPSDSRHVSLEADSALELSAEERIKKIWGLKHHWVPYPRASKVLRQCEELLARPQDPRLPCMLIYAEPNSGKTAILRRHAKLHAIDPNPSGDAIIAPVIFVELKGPDEGAFYTAVLDAIGAEFHPSDRPDKKLHQAQTILPQIGTRQLLVDEISTAVAGPELKQKKFLVAFKHFINRLELTVTAAGTKDALSALAVDKQIASRFEITEELPNWKYGDDFRRLLQGFENRLPLRKQSLLQRPTLAKKIHDITEGSIGELAELLMTAAVYAVRIGKEKIDESILDALERQSPSERRRKARQ